MKDGSQPRIVIVDDEEMILNSLQSLFSLESDYDVIAHSVPGEAASYVDDHPVDLVISDFLMPSMNGIEFLNRVKSAQPMATRVLLTGFADKGNAIKAINEVGIYQYIEKPWDNSHLKRVVENGLKRSNLLRRMKEMAAVKTDLIKALL